MKAKLYTQGTAMEVRVGSKVYSSTENEAKKDFLKRVQGLLETDFDEAIDIVEISTEKVLAKLSDSALTEAYKASKGGLQESILKGLLSDRGIEVEKIEKTARQKIETLDIEVVKKSEEYLNAKANVGKLIKFKPTKSEDENEIVEGVVKSISLNKTNTIIYYNVMSGDKLKCCTAKNETLEFIEF